MKTNRQILLLFIAYTLLLSNSAFSQEKEQKSFKSSGKVYGNVFANFHHKLFSSKNQSAFAVDRAYLGYKHNLSQEFTINLKLDIGSPNQDSKYDILKRYAYFKNAELIYKKNKLQISFGLINLYQFKIQEKHWGYRYIYKSFQDKHKFGNSADLGASVMYKFNSYITADITVANGEGYNQLQADNAYRTGVGVTIIPFKDLTTRFYADYTEKSEIQSSLSAFVGYKLKKIGRIGAEYNYQMNNKFKADHSLYGFSTYASYYVLKKWEIFARYDKLWSNTVQNKGLDWNINKDGSAIIAGVQFKPHRNIKIAANYQDWYPYAKNLENKSFFYLNLEYKF
ncbi:MAG: hypothetical protein MI739_14750 [Bacteroidales bacterium]|nr:hypothetical protein [Bacteroidales bacterium]